MVTVELERVRKSYGDFVAVDGLSFSISPGQIFGLLGPNGAGKTSSIRMMIGIITPDSGVVRLFGEPFERRHLHKIGYLPEERGLYKKITVRENLALLGQLGGLSARDAIARARKWAERLEIAEWVDKKVEEMSKGMQQKIQFIAALLHDPELIIMDEPFSGLDPINANVLKDVILELKEQGRTILFSTHRMDQVEKLCDAICLVNHGRAVLQGSLREVKSGYGSRFVQIAYEGDGKFLSRCGLVESSNNYGNYAEVKLCQGADAQALLRAAMCAAKISRFEVMEPSLEQIFIDRVEKANA
ncbi:MAG TPA: ATP-binding cassette domain-containing protein [Candidatus Binataceae bacterium]|nr:ATP-binding cassette domain-containing protein [Candidatus Binataceae bacterium]